MRVDIHTHCIPASFLARMRHDPRRYQAQIVPDAEHGEAIRHDQGYAYPLYRGFFDPEYRLLEMDRRRIDIDCLSVSPTLFYYWAEPALGAAIARELNDGIAAMAAARPDRFIPVGTLPMQDVTAALAELDRVARELGFPAVQIGTSVEGRHLDAPAYLPLFKRAAELGVTIVFHPYYVGLLPHLKDYYLTNLIGNPLDTTVCIARLVFGGVLADLPAARFVFVHGGGYIPFQRGRLQHGHKVRPEPRVVIGDKSPAAYIEPLYFDTITHWGPALKFLVASHGAGRVLLGSDYPFDMADVDPVRAVEWLGLSDADQARVLGGNALDLLGVKR